VQVPRNQLLACLKRQNRGARKGLAIPRVPKIGESRLRASQAPANGFSQNLRRPSQAKACATWSVGPDSTWHRLQSVAGPFQDRGAHRRFRAARVSKRISKVMRGPEPKPVWRGRLPRPSPNESAARGGRVRAILRDRHAPAPLSLFRMCTSGQAPPDPARHHT
jgi:hypothetical protein